MDYNQIYQTNSSTPEAIKKSRAEDPNRTIYWVIISKNKHSDKFYVGPYMTLEGANNRKMNSSGYVVIYPTIERDSQKVRIEYEQLKEME